MELLADLDAFYLEHRRCGELDMEIFEGELPRIVLLCSCGGQLSRGMPGWTSFLDR